MRLHAALIALLLGAPQLAFGIVPAQTHHREILGFSKGRSALSPEHKKQLEEVIEKLQECGPPSAKWVHIESGIREGATGPDYQALGKRAENAVAFLAARQIPEEQIQVTLFPTKAFQPYKNIAIADPYYAVVWFNCNKRGRQ